MNANQTEFSFNRDLQDEMGISNRCEPREIGRKSRDVARVHNG